MAWLSRNVVQSEVSINNAQHRFVARFAAMFRNKFHSFVACFTEALVFVKKFAQERKKKGGETGKGESRDGKQASHAQFDILGLIQSALVG